MEMLKVKLANYEGPFDVLLDIIRKNKMSIYDIQIYDLTKQYLEHLEQMKIMDLEITSEFIVVAATLLEIKSKTLLPKPKKEEEDEEDPRLILMRKLVEYKKIKQATEFFKERSQYSGQIFTKKPEVIEEVKSPINNEDILKNISMLDLFNIYNQLLDAHRSKRNTTNVIEKKIYVDKYKLDDKIEQIRTQLVLGKTYTFDDFMFECECKMEAIVTFLALLELIKLRNIKVTQEGNFTVMYIERMKEEDE